MNALLHVEKEKGVEVLFRPALEEYFTCSKLDKQPSSPLISVTIESYSKESHILSGSGSSVKMEIENVPKGFRQYLYDRKKAGVISYQGSTLYVLPPRNRDDTVLTWFTAVKSNHTEPSADQTINPSVQNNSNSVSKTSSSSSTKTPAVTAAPSQTVQPPSNPKNDGDFLSSLLNKMQSTSKLRTTVNVAAPTAVLARVEIVGRYEALASRIREQLEAFTTDPTCMELRLEPMDKDGMYVVHDVVDDYPELASIAIGDLEERHVVIYRIGFHPVGVDIHQQGTLVRVNVRKKKDTLYGKAVTSSSLQMESIAVERVNPDGDTRDRRTIEEIQQEMKRRKMGTK